MFLLNRLLTCSVGKAGSHHKLGWQAFTNGVVGRLLAFNPHIVLLLLGGEAQKILNDVPSVGEGSAVCTSHPSFFSWKNTCGDYPAFYGSSCFSSVNDKLAAHGISEIDWADV